MKLVQLIRPSVAAVLVLAVAHVRADEPMLNFIVVRADTLIGLSQNSFISPNAWREVARINKLRDPNRIMPGQLLRIPARLMRSSPVDARLISVTGEVRVGDAIAVAGATVSEGQRVQTGLASSAVVELADGSRLKLPPSSLGEVAASRHYGARAGASIANENPGSGWFAGTLRMLRGSVEIFATKVLRAKPLEVTTPTAVVGVRGTHYRVGLDGDGGPATHAETLEGLVRFDEPGARIGVDLPAGFGATSEPGSRLNATPLLPPPDLSTVPPLFERPVVRFGLSPESSPLRVQVASDESFDRIVSDQRVEAGTEIRIAGLDDAQWYLRARRVDTLQIEGLDSVRPFILKARPEPPASITPRAAAKQTVGTVDFAWTQNLSAPAVRLQVAEDAGFTRLVVDQDSINDNAAHIPLAKPGSYVWRLASIRPSGDHGPFGDPQSFELRPLPEPPTMERSADGSSIVFKWGGRPQDRQQVQLANDPGFTSLVAEADVTGSEWTQPLPPHAGRYYFRYRSIEPDGFVSQYSEVLTVDVPQDWSILFLLVPLLIVL